MSDITQTFDAAESGLLARKLDALGPYRLSGIIGEGGMGSVYRALQLAPVRREVAIKVTRVDLASAGRLARFQSECQILATLAHPNVAQVFDTGETPEAIPIWSWSTSMVNPSISIATASVWESVRGCN
jgi:serine/threonine protein kinase